MTRGWLYGVGDRGKKSFISAAKKAAKGQGWQRSGQRIRPSSALSAALGIPIIGQRSPKKRLNLSEGIAEGAENPASGGGIGGGMEGGRLAVGKRWGSRGKEVILREI